MIEFHCTKRDKTRTPILYNTEIWEYAEAVVGDYKPRLLKEPGKVNAIYFLESYLGASVDYQDIYYKDGESPIAGATIFNDDVILVFDREGMCVNTIPVSANTIILDNATVEDGKEGFANFTALHEGGHFSMHPAVYKRNELQLCIFEEPKQGRNVVCCRKSSIERRYLSGRQKLTSGENREHQANVYAAFVAMPRQTFIPCATELIKDVGFREGIYIYDDKGGWEYPYYLDQICGKLADLDTMKTEKTKPLRRNGRR